MDTKIERYVSYITFIIGFNFMRRMIGDAPVDNDAVYDYSEDLAMKFVGSEYDDAIITVNECVYSFVMDELSNIKKWFADTQGMYDIGDPILAE